MKWVEKQFFFLWTVVILVLCGVLFVGTYANALPSEEQTIILQLENFNFSLKPETRISKINLTEELSGDQVTWELENIKKNAPECSNEEVLVLFFPDKYEFCK